MRLARFARTAVTSLVALLIGSGLMVGASGTAAADPSANAWLQLRRCESGNRYAVNTGNGYYGAYQFSLGTWASVGGTGLPSDAKPAEQDYRALMLYRKRGWSPWTCAAMIGLHEDADAGSGIMPPKPASFDTPYDFVAGATVGATSGAPAWPGQQFAEGDSAAAIATWQAQAAALGYPVIATGYFGPTTASAVKAIQTKKGIAANGLIGAQTWDAAWSLVPGSGTATSSGGTDPDVVYVPQTRAQCSVGAPTAPAAPTSLLTYGQTSRPMQCFQWQLATRGAPLSGTAYFGSVTLTVVTKLQAANKITGEVDSSGRPAVGPKTWVAAWQGAY
jgi:peptidoglycan hydrolase-like protein with peptidoglycan-binding domain